MGGIVSHLICLFCRSGCNAKHVASMLAFMPPTPPLYRVREGPGAPQFEVAGLAYRRSSPALSVHFVPCNNGDRICAILLRQPGAKFTVLFSHGNATDLGPMLDLFVALCETAGVNVLAYDYSGYGASSGSPSETAVYRNIDAMYDFAVESGVTANPRNDLILYGQSVGSGPSCYLASRRPVRALILHSPILSGLRVITPNRCLCCCDIFPNVDRMPRMQCPVFVIHGKDDEEVGFHHGVGLHDATPVPHRVEPWWVDSAHHNDIVAVATEEYFRRIRLFVQMLERTGRSAGSV